MTQRGEDRGQPENTKGMSMDLTGEYRIAASRERVWEALNDPEILKASIPGCSDLQAVGENSFAATVTAKVGPVKAKFQGQVTLSDMDPPNGYTIEGEGKGGAAGFAKGGAKVTLVPDGDGTLLRYEVNANVGGKLAQIGSRLIDGTAKKLSAEFFTAFAALAAGPAVAAAPVAAPEPAAAEPVAAEPSPPAAPAAAPEPGKAPEKAGAGLPRWVWLGGLIIIMIAILALLGGK